MSKKKKKIGVLARIKRLLKELEALDLQSDGRVSSLIFAFICFLGMVLLVIIACGMEKL